MSPVSVCRRITSVFRRDDGAVAVEFIILLPLMMATFAFIVEASRIYWNYQSAVSGVRDASRYIARTTDSNVCEAGGPTFDTAAAGGDAAGIIQDTMRDEAALFPSGVTLTGVSATLLCVTTATLRNPVTPVVRVQATVNVTLPFGGLFEFFINRQNGVMTSQITDQSRIYGI